MNIFVFLLMFIFPIFAFGETGMSGYWSVKCGVFGGSIEINSADDAKININNNNLYILAKLNQGPNGKMELYYQSVVESENNIIDWANISISKPIAVVSLQDSVLSISWNGFYDIKKKQYVWKNEPDFVVAIENRQNIKMKKCNFN